jgi:hypothetical protein
MLISVLKPASSVPTRNKVDTFDSLIESTQPNGRADFWRIAISGHRDYRESVSSPYLILMWTYPPQGGYFFAPLLSSLLDN